VSMEDDVRAASNQFYAALTSMAHGDAGLMAAIWSHGETVTTMHPRGGREIGWDQVRTSFEQVAQIASGGRVDLADRVIEIAGDTAYEIGVERGQITLAGEAITIDHRATNIYRRQADGWKIIHHHTDLAPAMVALVERLEAKV